MVQHRAARLIFGKMDRCQLVSVTALMKELHWLPVRWRIQFKVLCLVYRCRHGMGPGYLANDLVAHCPPRTLRSSAKGLLEEVKAKLKTVGDRAFSVAGPAQWNRLPDEIRLCLTLGVFKRKLKTHLFRIAYELN